MTRTYMSPFGRPTPTWKCGAYGRFCDTPGVEVRSFDARLQMRTLGRSRSQPVIAASKLGSMESATGMKLQMLQMVQDLSTMQRRSLSARKHLKVTQPADLKVEEMKKEVGADIQAAREDIDRMFAIMMEEGEDLQTEVDDLTRHFYDMQGYIDKMEEKICGMEGTIGHL